MNMSFTKSIASYSIATAVAAIILWRRSLKREQTLNQLEIPVELNNWLDEDTFSVVESLIDALIPSHKVDLVALQTHPNETSTELYNFLRYVAGVHLSSRDYLRNESIKAHIYRGAIDQSQLHVEICKAMSSALLPEDKMQIYLFLKALSTSVGSLLLTGYPVPFQHLRLGQRIAALKRLQHSWLGPLRGAFMAFKRVAGFFFLSYSKRGEKNSSWGALKYEPDIVLNKLSRNSESLSGKDARKISLETVKAFDGVPHEAGASPNVVDGGSFDVIVVGSGSGGGVIASELVHSGLNVLLLEKGEHWGRDDFKAWRETEACAKTLERSGLCSTEDGAIVVLAGSCVGGGSTVNWSASLRTPRHVLKCWSEEMGMKQFDPDADVSEGGSFVRSLDEVHQLLSVNTRMSHRQGTDDKHESDSEFVVNLNNILLWSSAESLQLKPEVIPRNVKGCVDCGHCSHGCPYGAKQSTATALIEPILLHQQQQQKCGDLNITTKNRGRLTLLTNCYVQRVLTKPISSDNLPSHSQAAPEVTTEVRGVEARVTEYPLEESCPSSGPGRPMATRVRTVVFHSNIVVSSSGAIHTPALLLRSGLTHPKIGRHLCLHPVVAVAGMLPRRHVGLSKGVGMGVIVRSLRDPAEISANSTTKYGLDEKSNHSLLSDECKNVLTSDWGVIVETPPVHPGLAGVVMPWIDGLQFKLSSLSYSNMGAFIAIARDRSSANNRIVLSASGEPVIRYSLTNADKKTLHVAHELIVRMFYATGAAVVTAITESSQVGYYCKNEFLDSNANDEHFERYIRRLNQSGIVPNITGLFSAHQMGSCRMANNVSEGPVRPTGETYECRGLWVADASTFPTAVGVNPMITVAAMAHMVSVNLLKQCFPTAVTDDPGTHSNSTTTATW